MNLKNKYKKGFTLIELLVVISIISLLSSIVMTALSGARAKARDAVIKQEVGEFTTLMNLEFDDNQSYCNLQQNNWINSTDNTCAGAFSAGNYTNQARLICQKIYDNISGVNSTQKLYFATSWPTYLCGSYYTIMVKLNNGKWYCAGSSGRKGEYADFGGSPGCNDNP